MGVKEGFGPALWAVYTLPSHCDPSVPPQILPTLSLVASLAVADALERVRSSCNPLIKWPNDVLCPEGKLAGISLEALAGGVCVGVGVNVYEPFAKREVEGKYSLAYLQDGVVEAGLSAEQRYRHDPGG